MSGCEQTDAQGLGFERAVEPCLAGQEYVGAGASGVGEKIVASATSDGNAPNWAIRIAGHRHGNAAEHRADERGESLEGASFAVGSNPPGSGWSVGAVRFLIVT